MTDPAVPSANSWIGMRLLPGVLSLTAGSMDVISFLGLGGLFTAHITGNLVIVAAHVVTGEAAQWAAILSVPVFMLCLARLSAGGFETIGLDLLQPLLLVQFLLLSGSLIIGVAAGPDIDPNTAIATVAGMLAVSAMAVQNALVQVSLHGVPATAVITANIARFTTDVGTILLGARRDEVVAARERADRLWPSIAGFIIGCCMGAVCEARFGLRALALPAGLALLALATAAKSNATEAQVAALSVPDQIDRNRFGSL